jgi:hypothetical protein
MGRGAVGGSELLRACWLGPIPLRPWQGHGVNPSDVVSLIFLGINRAGNDILEFYGCSTDC